MGATIKRISAKPLDGFIDRRRAGEAWPRGGEGREVLVLDQANDPEGRVHEGRFAIGLGTLAVLESDPDIFIRDAAGVSAGEADKLKARVAELESALEDADEQVKGAADENAKLKARVAELESAGGKNKGK